MGPNVKRLIAHKVSLDAVPRGGGLVDAVAFLKDTERLSACTHEAIAWVEAALEAVKAAPGNPYGDDDEAIAGELLRRIETRKKGTAPS